ncbi:MAG: hybrid sensor histidine kinase/response regulator, partial [Xanthomonadales bacterium]|nr:hybrid sensor histidine kinase/response regulator [Xanthomonadales bacterium]
MRGRLILSALLLGSGLGLPAPGGTVRAETRHEQVSAPLPTPQFRHYGVAEGLSGGAVHDLAQDQDGLMWFAVGADLVRFDGVEFTAFRHRQDDPSSLPAGSKRGLFVDRDNQLWLGGLESGLARRAADGQGFSRWVHDSGEPGSLSSDAVWCIAQTADGELWVGTEAGLDHLLADGRRFEHVAPPPTVGRSGFGAVHALLAESDGRLWIGTGHGLFLRSPAGLLRRVVVDARLAGEPVVWRIQGGGNDVRVAVSGGSLRVDPDGIARLVAPAMDPAVVVHGSARDQLGRLWTATSSGLYFEDGGHATRIPAQPQLRGGLPGYHVAQALIDHEGGLWLALDAAGVGYLAPNWSLFTRMTHVAGDATSLSGYAATAVAASGDGKLWVGAGDTVDKLDPATGRVQHVLRGLPGEVRDLLEGRDGSLWIIAGDAVYRHTGGSLLQIDIRPARALEPRRLALGANGAVLVASLRQGMFQVHRGTLELRPAAWAPGDGNLVLPNRLTANQVLDWYANGSHLWRWNTTHARFEDAPSLSPGGPVLALETTADGLWVARGNRFEHYRAGGSYLARDRELPTLADWPTLTLRGMHVDRLGRVWLFADEGLWRFDPVTSGAWP